MDRFTKIQLQTTLLDIGKKLALQKYPLLVDVHKPLLVVRFGGLPVRATEGDLFFTQRRTIEQDVRLVLTSLQRALKDLAESRERWLQHFEIVALSAV